MITPAYVRTMAAYNTEMNRRLYAAAARIPDAERRADRGAFWRSIHGTLVHLLWGDQVWMARFDGWPRPSVRIKESAGMIDDFDTLAAERVKADERIASGREMKRQRGFLVAHLFNHQTHHRGQAHAMITACGQPTGDTDLMLILDGPR
jgi:uncharacterized damage-inducible protein DinB